MISPYSDVPEKAFWRNTAARRASDDTKDFFRPRFIIDQEKAKVATAGSCFAQHVGWSLKEAGYRVLDVEALPPAIPRSLAGRFGYQMYSARYGNIYTVRQMRQLLEEAFDGRALAEPVWEKNGRFHDAQRPGVDPGGLAAPEEVMLHRTYHLGQVRELFSQADVFVFTLGLTEAWMDREKTTVYPTAPGTIAGSFDPERHVFHNFRFNETFDDFVVVRDRLKAINPNMKFLITVSPVPLTATATEDHVEVATSRSKSTLRAVCAELYDAFEDVDYFPSYEIITAQAAHGDYFERNLRSVTPEGVGVAMRTFLAAQSGQQVGASAAATEAGSQAEDDVICEEVLLEGFAKK